MKTLKKFFTCLETLIKKIFFNSRKLQLDSNCGTLSVENRNSENNDDLLRMEEYYARYRSTTRWQTL